jgi:hypothetical protein
MGEADTMEVKQRLAKSLNVVIERSGPRVSSPMVPACDITLIITITRLRHMRK